MTPAAALFLAAMAGQAAPETIVSHGNPILADGRFYSTDPAPIVVGDTLYILAGRDEAPDGVNDFIMNEWQLLSTKDPGSGRWQHYPNVARPHDIFAWAEAGRAYAGQIVRGADRRFYLYAPVLQRVGPAKDRFAIGVAVADDPRGPWRDAHPAGPIISQIVPVANDIQNIDPTVLVEDEGRVTIIWGTFGQLRGMALKPDMVTPAGPEVTLTGATGFFEAPWLMKRRGTYYLLYAANNPGPDSPCTPTLYHACQAYASAPGPLGPWTYRGVVLPPVSSTTSHAGAIEFRGRWYLAYHTADAVGGGHFRRSVAIDPMAWDDSVSPAAIRPVVPTRIAHTVVATRNVATGASVATSAMPVPVQFWLRAVNDGMVRAAPLPPDMWSDWRGAATPAQAWLEYRWPLPVTIEASRIRFFTDQPAGARAGTAPPKDWRLEYWRDGRWQGVAGVVHHGRDAAGFDTVIFPPITTRCLRAVFTASGDTRGHAAVAVEEWEALAPRAAPPPSPPHDVAPPCAT
ncbi:MULTISPECIES: family 43 glycosylhydrolase [unclassified Sphingomonas]|uniref:family 43 glycosylhydrolase n=2 Tax=Pseudomonadota TaxID=1224 RepID=UPI001E35AFCA|nr:MULTISPECIES: family 43 glycosylhydrolase [unclassified Sphingomonas]